MKSSPKVNSKRRIVHLVILPVSALLLDFLTGCKITKMRLMPELDRNGEYFYLSRRYPETQFLLWGAALSESDGSFSLLPRPSAIFPGFPLLLVEKYVICPVIDILWLPEDFIRNCYLQSESSVTGNGYYLQVMDVWGRPLKGIKVACDGINGHYNRPSPVLKGRRHSGGCFGYTDENGELYVPYDCTTVTEVRANAYASSAQGEYVSTCYEPGYRHPPFQMKSRDYRGAVYKGSVDPDILFPKRDQKRRVRIVIEPELEWPDGGHARWKFIPDGVSELKESEEKAGFYMGRTNLDDL